MKDPVTAIAQAITEGFKLLKQHNETKQVRTMRKCIEAGEKYIQVNEGEGEYDYEMTDKKRNQKLSYFKKRFFRLNQ